MKKLEKERQFRKHHRIKFIVTLVVVLVVFLAAIQVFVSNRLANLGQEIEKEADKTEKLSLENSILEEEIGEKESLTNISEKAKELGLIEANSIYYLVPQIPVAMK